MSDHDATWQHLTVSEAAERLGVSTATVRRMVRAGKLEGDTVLRPQGKTYVVRLPRQASLPADQVADTDHVPGGVSRGNVAAQEAMAAWSTSVLTPILAPIVAELTASRVANEQKAETIGRLTAELERAASIAVKLSDELDAARAQISTLEAPTAASSVDPTPGPLGVWWYVSITGAVAVLALVVVIMVLVWPW